VHDAHNLYRVCTRDAVQDEVSPATSATRHVERAQTGQNVITLPAAKDVGTFSEGGERGRQRVAIDASLVQAERVGRPPEDRLEVVFGRLAQPDAAAAPCHV